MQYLTVIINVKLILITKMALVKFFIILALKI